MFLLRWREMDLPIVTFYPLRPSSDTIHNSFPFCGANTPLCSVLFPLSHWCFGHFPTWPRPPDAPKLRCVGSILFCPLLALYFFFFHFFDSFHLLLNHFQNLFASAHNTRKEVMDSFLCCWVQCQVRQELSRQCFCAAGRYYLTAPLLFDPLRVKQLTLRSRKGVNC